MANHKLFSSTGLEVFQHDLQDKKTWCKTGETLEVEFLKKFGDKFDLRANEEKSNNPTLPDFIHNGTSRYVDLKTQNTPFFSASKYQQNRQYAVTFNNIDLQRYRELYPRITVIFHVIWEATKIKYDDGRTFEVRPMSGIWAATIEHISKHCTADKYHAYQQRVSDNKGNAKGSFVLDLRCLTEKHREI